MSKICKQCGAQLEDNMVFCDKCGAKQDAEPALAGDNGAKGSPFDRIAKKIGMSSSSLIGVVVIAVVAIIIIILLCSLIGGGGYKKPLNALEKAINNEDASKYIKTLNDTYVSEYEKEYDEDLEDEFEDKIDSLVDSFEDEYGKKPKIDFEVIDTIKMTDDELKAIYKAYYKELDKDLEVTKGYKVAIKVTVKGKDDKVEYFTTTNIVKVDGTWMFAGGYTPV